MPRRTTSTAAGAAACLMLALAGLLPFCAQGQGGRAVIIATEGDYAPWNLTRADGVLDGFEVELVHDLCTRMRLECRLVAQDWNGMIASLQAGKVDVLMDALSITEERRLILAFSRPYARTAATFVALRGSALGRLPLSGRTLSLSRESAPDDPAVQELRAALRGRTIAIQAASIYARFIYLNFGDIATVREYKSSAEHDLDVLAGRADVAFDDATYFKTALANADERELTLSGPLIGGAIWGEGEGFGFRRDDVQLKAAFDAAVAAAIADGTVRRLSEKWLKIDVTPYQLPPAAAVGS
ncbi:MAG: transporter substrate-binding domain-containing protein, partial [Steroidobacteraceae bacterium]